MSTEFEAILTSIVDRIRRQMESRCWRSAVKLKNASLDVLEGTRSGRVYKLSGTHGKRRSKATKVLIGEYGHKLKGGQLYRASAPGEPPAVRLHTFRPSWQPTTQISSNSFISRIESNVKVGKGKGHNLGGLLEYGTSKMAPRPHHERIVEKAKPDILRIYQEPYL